MSAHLMKGRNSSYVNKSNIIGCFEDSLFAHFIQEIKTGNPTVDQIMCVFDDN